MPDILLKAPLTKVYLQTLKIRQTELCCLLVSFSFAYKFVLQFKYLVLSKANIFILILKLISEDIFK